jgi:hypothetical protein
MSRIFGMIAAAGHIHITEIFVVFPSTQGNRTSPSFVFKHIRKQRRMRCSKRPSAAALARRATAYVHPSTPQ